MLGIFKLLYKVTGNRRLNGLPFRFIYLNSQQKPTTPFYFLDIGCGNHSVTYAKQYFPNCKYYGLDLNREYNNDENEFKLMEDFYEANLEESDLNQIPASKFDYINMAHVIEHIKNHEKVLERLSSKLNKDGIIYIEYPNWRSTKLPSMYQTLNFFDDSTHVHIHSNRDLANVLLKLNMRIIKMGTRRDIFEIINMPRWVLGAIIKGKRISGTFFWSFLGFSDYIIARKN